MRLWLAALALLACVGAAHAAATSQCGPTSVGTSAVAVTFPAASTNGPSQPALSLSIMVPSGTNYLCVNPVGGTAATSGSGCAAGSLYIAAQAAPLFWASRSSPPPASLSVVASGSSTPMSCFYQ